MVAIVPKIAAPYAALGDDALFRPNAAVIMPPIAKAAVVIAITRMALQIHVVR